MFMFLQLNIFLFLFVMYFLSYANNQTLSKNIITLFGLGISCEVSIDQHNVCFCNGIVIWKKEIIIIILN